MTHKMLENGYPKGLKQSDIDKESIDFAIKIVREAVELWVKKRERLKAENYPKELEQPKGVFVTIYSFPEKELRGCIGYPDPARSLIQVLIDSSIEATQDPRFEPVKPEELDKIIIEVSILTEPELVSVKNPLEFLEKIETGRDGLIIKKGFRAGLLLPKVPIEYGWDTKTFLEQLCIKAGLTPDQWADESSRIYKFQAITHEEKSPGVA